MQVSATTPSYLRLLTPKTGVLNTSFIFTLLFPQPQPYGREKIVTKLTDEVTRGTERSSKSPKVTQPVTPTTHSCDTLGVSDGHIHARPAFSLFIHIQKQQHRRTRSLFIPRVQRGKWRFPSIREATPTPTSMYTHLHLYTYVALRER